MTRKKQGAPQKLNSKLETETSTVLPERFDVDKTEDPSPNPEQRSKSSSESRDIYESKQAEMESTASFVLANCGPEPRGDKSSCEKLLSFAQNFSFSNGITQPPAVKKEISEITNRTDTSPANPDTKQNSCDAREASSKSSLVVNSQFHPQTAIKTEVTSRRDVDNHETHSTMVESQLKDEKLNNNYLSHQQANLLKGLDLASMSAAQQIIMDAVRQQQKRFYEQCPNNWINVQRTDNNCLSKSKAERYRWCVQGNDTPPKTSRSNPPSQSHVNNLKKSASMAGMGVTPVQDKLYSTVFTGASKFCCRDCGNPFNTLVDLTVHMNKTGHFRDSNTGNGKPNTNKDSTSSSSSNLPKKRSLAEEEAQGEKVLTCMGCGHLFESLQDLSVHMIKTKHYENVPSLRMWSQKQSTPPENAVAPRKRSLPAMGSYKNNECASAEPSLARSPFGLPPYLTGLNPSVAAAAYTSLLYSSPWLGSSFPPLIPSLYPGTTGIPYPYPPGLFGGPFPPNPFAFPLGEEQELHLSCTKCKEKFTSLQKLSDHIQETLHYPDIDQLGAFAGFPSNQFSDPKDGSSHSPRPRSCHSADKGSSFVSKPSTSATPAKKARQDYAQTSPELPKRHPVSSFDFIRSLESTIKSAISKVETVTNEDKPGAQRSTSKATESNHRTGFSPFSRMTDSPSDENFKLTNHKHSSSKPQLTRSKSDTEREKSKIQANEKRREHELPSSVSICKTFSNLTEKSESPLDLTVKKEEGGKSFSAKLPFPTTSRKSIFSTNSDSKLDPNQPKDSINHSVMQSSPYKSPLQSLHDDMQAFFSLKKSDLIGMGQNGMTSPSKNIVTKQPDPYKPLMMPTSSNFTSSNPLQEILKIVNSQDLMKTADKGCKERLTKRSSLDTSSVEPKKSKLFSLNDLVMPKEETPLATVNPLQKIQDLVDNKLARSGEKRLKSEVEKLRDSPTSRYSDSLFTASSSGSRASQDSATSATSSAASALLSLRSSASGANRTNKNGFHRNGGVADSFLSKNSSVSSTGTDVSTEELQLEAAFAQLCASGKAMSASDDEISKYIDLTSHKVSDWFEKMTKEFQLNGKLSFLRCHDDGDGAKRMEMVCRRCGQLFDTPEQFSNHVTKHIGESKGDNDADTDNGVEFHQPTTNHSTVRGKCTIQGAVCIGSYKSFKHAMSANQNGLCHDDDDVKNDIADDVINYNNKCSDESSNDEPITVSS